MLLSANNRPLPSGVENEHGQITDKKLLKVERIKFGISNIMYQGEEVGLGAIHMVIVRALGGSNVHIGMLGAINGIGSLFQWVGSLLLKKFNSNRNAMVVALSLGVIISLLIAGLILIPLCNPGLGVFMVWGYIILNLALASASGIQWNIETNWIGDLVPTKLLGWFTSVKWVVAVFGILCFTMFFGKVVDLWPRLTTYAALFVLIAASHIIAILLVRTITDRTPKTANFVSAGASRHDRLNYKAWPLWAYISFFMLWSGGRTAMMPFTAVYLLDYFHYSMTQIAGLAGLQSVVSMVMLLVMGKLSDIRGNRIMLLVISGVVSACMLLWVGSAWWGIVPIIANNIINGAAGHTHSMLSLNYGLEIFPEKGRSGYLALSRVIIGATCIATPILGGILMSRLEGFEIELWGATLNNFHIFFFICSGMTMASVLPLLIVGKRTVSEG